MASWPWRHRPLLEDHRNIQPRTFNVGEPVISPALFLPAFRAQREERMRRTLVGRRAVLKTISAAAAAGVIAAPQRIAAQQVKWSAGTEAPKLRAPADAADCHHHIYDAKYPVDPRSTLRPGDASVED